jgi:hypothetical protein
MEIIQAEIAHAKLIAEAQLLAYKRTEEFEPGAKHDTLLDIELRLGDDDWRVFIGFEDHDSSSLIAGISYLLNASRDAAYACRWFSTTARPDSARVYRGSLPLLQACGVRKLFARIYDDDRWIRIYKKDFRDASHAEIDECKALMGNKTQTTGRRRIYLIRDL